MLLGAPALSQFLFHSAPLVPAKKLTGQIILVKMFEEAQHAQGQKHTNH